MEVESRGSFSVKTTQSKHYAKHEFSLIDIDLKTKAGNRFTFLGNAEYQQDYGLSLGIIDLSETNPRKMVLYQPINNMSRLSDLSIAPNLQWRSLASMISLAKTAC